MSIKKRIERLEGALRPKGKVHVVSFADWPREEQEAYDRASEEEKWEMVRAHLSEELGEDGIVVISAIPRPEGSLQDRPRSQQPGGDDGQRDEVDT